MRRDEPDAEDAGLVAYLDGELPPDERTALEGRLARDPSLRARLERLAEGDRPFREAYDALGRSAPVDRLTKMLESVSAARTRKAVVLWPRLRPAAIAAGLALFLGGGAAGYFAAAVLSPIAPRSTVAEDAPEAWRDSVADYFALTTSQTLTALVRDRASIDRDLAAVGKKLDLDLPRSKIELPGQTIRRVELFHAVDAPLAQIAYLHPDMGPVALCILGRAQAPEAIEAERRRGMNIAYWSTSKHAYMLVGRAPEEALVGFAQRLAAQLDS
jgi:anti-sigma factor RsiW